MRAEELCALAKHCGFDDAAVLDAALLRFSPEVRAMCAADRCRSYNRSWSCPPAVGTPEELQARCRAFHRALLVQSFGEREDPFDFDAIRETEHRHRESFARLEERLRERLPALLAMGLGPCRLCADCTWPDAPCRFPERVFPPMEAYGLSVSELCRAHGLSYYRGPTGICFTGCFLYTL